MVSLEQALKISHFISRLFEHKAAWLLQFPMDSIFLMKKSCSLMHPELPGRKFRKLMNKSPGNFSTVCGLQPSDALTTGV